MGARLVPNSQHSKPHVSATIVVVSPRMESRIEASNRFIANYFSERSVMRSVYIAMATIVFNMLVSSLLNAQVFYSVDLDTDELVTINGSTGQVTTIGSLGTDIKNTVDLNLAMYNGDIYAVVTDLDNFGADLFRIDRMSGQATDLGQIFAFGQPASVAEGVYGTENGLRVSFTTSNTQRISSNLGTLGLDGQISNVSNVGDDMDALAFVGGQLYSVDSQGSNDRVLVFEQEPNNLLGTFPAFGMFFTEDMATWNDQLWGISPGGMLLIDRNNGALINATSFSRAGDFAGIAAIPEPSSVTLLLCVGLGIHFTQRRRA
jgi:hypothetical protein